MLFDWSDGCCPGRRVVTLPVAGTRQQEVPIVLQVAIEWRHGPVRDQPEAVGRQLDDVGIMADDDDGTVESVDRLNQRLARIDVQMVRRLVEQQDMGPVSRHQGKQETCLLAS